jgi:hypothetical protein
MEDTHVMMQMFGQRVDNPSAWSDPASFTEENLQVHKEVYEAVLRHDAVAARRAMHRHMRRAGANMLDRFDWLQRHRDADEAQAEDFPESMLDSVRDIQNRDESRLSKETGLGEEEEAEE